MKKKIAKNEDFILGLYGAFELAGISLEIWLFIVLSDVIIFFLWCIAVGVKEYLKEKKEVSLQM